MSCIARNELRTPSRNTRLEHAIRTVLLSALLLVPALAAGAPMSKTAAAALRRPHQPAVLE